jgi:hypothetical protein
MAAANRMLYAWAAMRELPFAQLMCDTFGNRYLPPSMLEGSGHVKKFVINTPILKTFALIFGVGDG